jgi:hypothetical protein
MIMLQPGSGAVMNIGVDILYATLLCFAEFIHSGDW